VSRGIEITGRFSRLLLAVVAVLVPAISIAQSTATMSRVGILSWSSCANLPAALMTGLADLGYIPDKTFTMECRSAEQSYDRLVPAAEELVRARVDVIVALSHPAARAARLATDLTPIVMIASGDPVASGLVDSLAHPGGNVTGLTYYATELTGKRLEILREMVPTISVIGVLANPAVAYLPFEKDTKRAAAALGVRLATHQVAMAADLADAFTTMAKEDVDAVFILPDLMLSSEAGQIAELALRHHLPTMAWGGWFTRAGGLIAYSAEYANMSRTLASYVDKVLRGAKPGDLPVDQPTRFVLSINLKTAKALGIEVPRELEARAEELIE
jgi:putative ABC transport system substrate-binding protein